MANTNNHLVIMAGGVGSRFWPMSTSDKPKQFIDVLGTGKTLLQLTVDRFGSLVKSENIWVVTNQKYAAIVKEQLPDMPEGNILCEPCRRNTAPCIAYVSWRIKSKDPKANIVVTPSDHIVTDKAEFQRVVKECMVFTSETDSIVTLGMKPNRPETGYGYIQADLSTSSLRNKEIFRVDSFREKPDLETAKEYLAAGNYVWNAGIFVWNVRTIVEELRKHAPQISDTMDRIAASFGSWKEEEVLKELFPTCEKISIDYAVMEKSDRICTVASDLGWSDLGGYSSIKANIPLPDDDPMPDKGSLEQAKYDNRMVGQGIELHDCEGCIVHADDGHRVIVQGLKDYIVAVKGSNVLVCSLSEEQKIKEYSQKK